MAKVEPSSLIFPEELADLSKEKDPFFCRWVDKVNSHNMKDSRLLMITYWEFYLFRKPRFSKALQLKKQFLWYDIKKLEMISPTNFKIYIDEEDTLTISYLLATRLFEKMYTYLINFLLPSEYPEFVFLENYKAPKVKGSIISHMRMKMKQNGHILSKAAENSIIRFVKSKEKTFRLNQIQSIIDSLPIFLEILSLMPHVDTLIVPCAASYHQLDIMNMLKDCLLANDTIHHLIFRDKLPDNFSDFLDALRDSENDNIETLQFTNGEFTLLHTISLAKYIQAKPIKILIAKSCLSPITFNPFLQSIDDNTGFQNITKLFLDRSPGLNVNILMTSLPKLQIVSLQKCDFEITDFFDTLMRMKSKLRSCNISGNKCNRRFQNDIFISQYLCSITIDNVLWETESFKNFFKNVLKHKPLDYNENPTKLKLSLSNSRIPGNVWVQFFKIFLKKKTYSEALTVLKWNENPIHPIFFEFCQRCQSINELSFNGVFTAESKSFPFLLDYIAAIKNLETLSLAGTARVQLGELGVRHVIRSLRKNRSIKSLDISNNKAGPKMLEDLAYVLMLNRLVESIKFDGNDITNMDSFHVFFEKLKARGLPLVVPWPQQEVDDMLQFGTTTESKVKKVRELYNQVTKGDKTIKVDEAMINKEPNVKAEEEEEEEDTDETEDSGANMYQPLVDDILF